MRDAVAPPTALLFVAGDPEGREERAALRWLAERRDYAVATVPAAALAAGDLAGVAAVWVHASEHPPRLTDAGAAALAEFTARGGGVVLTLSPPPSWCRSASRPRPRTVRRSRSGTATAARRARRACRRGARTRSSTGSGAAASPGPGREGERVSACVYARPRWPGSARVALVERADAAVRADVAVGWTTPAPGAAWSAWAPTCTSRPPTRATRRCATGSWRTRCAW
jgi:hypothetical protein